MQNVALHLRGVRRREQLFNFCRVVTVLHLRMIDLQLALHPFNFGQHRVDTAKASIEEIDGVADGLTMSTQYGWLGLVCSF